MSDQLTAIKNEVARKMTENLRNHTSGLSVPEAREVLLRQVLKRVTHVLVQMTISNQQPTPTEAMLLLSVVTQSNVVTDLYQALGLCSTPHEMIDVFIQEYMERMNHDIHKIVTDSRNKQAQEASR